MAKEGERGLNVGQVAQIMVVCMLILLSAGCFYLFLEVQTVQQQLHSLRFQSSSAYEQVPTGDARETAAKERRHKRDDSPCGGEVVLDDDNMAVNITSPNYPNDYPNGVDCEWIVRPTYPTPFAYSHPAGPILYIMANDTVSIESSADCSADSLTIRANDIKGPVLGRFCGENVSLPRSITHRGPLHISFKSDGKSVAKGFSLSVRCPAQKTYIRWGKRFCLQGSVLYDGYAVGHGQTIACAPYPVDLQHGDTEISGGMALATLKYKADAEMMAAIGEDVGGKMVRCARCHMAKTELFTVIGWNSCHSSEWTTVYSGFLMGIDNGGKTPTSSESICLDRDPDQFTKEGAVGAGPQLAMFTSGYGFWFPNKPVPCAVCAK